MKLYPIITTTLDQTVTSEDFQQLWQSIELPENTQYYGVYFNYQDNGNSYDFAIASERLNGNVPIELDNLTWYERFSTSVNLLSETWEYISHKGKQGLLRRSFTVDFEQYQPDGKVDVFISIVPHC